MKFVQKVILKSRLQYHGLNGEQAEYICLLLSCYSHRIQQAVYYRTLGYTQAQIGEIIGCSERHAGRLISKAKKVNEYLKIGQI